MPRRLALSLLFGSLTLGVAFPRTVEAQSPTQAVSLSATVGPHATIEHRTAPAVHGRLGDTTEYRVTLVVRANTSYRIVARRNGVAGSDVTLGVMGSTARLAPDRDAVQITRGGFGRTTFEIKYEVETMGLGSGAAVVTFEAMPDPELR